MIKLNNTLKLSRLDRPLLCILLFSLIIRLVVFVFYPDQQFPDADAYRNIGREIFSGNIITNNIYMPLYPIFTYLTGGALFQTLFDIFISVMSVYLIFLLSFQIFKTRLAALLSAAISSIYPHFIFYSLSGLTEILFTFLLLLSFIFLYQKRFLLASFILVLSLLTRPTFDLFNPFLVICFVGFVHSLGWRLISKYVGIYFICYLVLMAPWWVHQSNKYGEFVRLTLGDGVILYAGNNPLNKTGGGIIGEDADLSAFVSETNPILRNNLMRDAALKFIMENPSQFIENSGIKFLRFWRLWPHTSSYQQWYIFAASLLSYGVVLFAFIGFVFRNSRYYFRELTPVLALFSYLTAVHMVTIGSLRYRFPLEPFLIIFAGYFLIDILKNQHWFFYIINKYDIDTIKL